jgi:hypothetical protein
MDRLIGVASIWLAAGILALVATQKETIIGGAITAVLLTVVYWIPWEKLR